MKPTRVKISQIAKVRGGKRLPKGEDLLTTETSNPYIRAQDIRDGRIRLEDPRYLTPEQHRRLKRYTVSAGDVCIVIVGANVGDVGIVPESLNGANLTENAVKLTDFRLGYVPQYVNYCLSTPECQAQMQQFAGGAAQPKLGIYKVLDIEVPAQPESNQHRIAFILSPYDDLIENNARRITILEEMGKMIYREWFVNFRFPGHKEVKMVESESGQIPHGWSATRLGDVLQLEYGKALKSAEREGGAVPVFGSSGVVGFHNQSLADGPGIIVGRKGNVGSVFFCPSEFWVIDTAYYVRTSLSPYFLFLNLLTQNFLNNDAAVPGLNRNQAHSLPIIVPDTDTMERFNRLVTPMFRQQAVLRELDTILKKTRDLLLRKLIFGEVSVDHFEAEPVAQGV